MAAVRILRRGAMSRRAACAVCRAGSLNLGAAARAGAGLRAPSGASARRGKEVAIGWWQKWLDFLLEMI
jgi:hypothetical protein